MRNGKGLTELATPHRALLQFGEKGVGVIVKSLYIGAGQDQKRVGGAPVIKLWSAAIIGAMKITERESGLHAFSVINHALRTKKNIRYAVSADTASCKVRYRFRNSQKFQTWCDRKLYNLVEAVARRKLRRVVGRYKTCFKLEISYRCECRGSGDGRAPGICFRLVNNC